MAVQTPFADLEDQMAADSISMLANAAVSISGGEEVACIFDAEYEQHTAGEIGGSSSGPAVSLLSSDVPSSPVGRRVTVRGVTYAIAEARPDGAGVTVLILERRAS